MPRIDIEKIVLQKTVHGPACPACGGVLQPAPVPRHWWNRVLGAPRQRFQCTVCRKRYQLRPS